MEDLWERLEAYVRSYLPWWRYERDGREPEAALMAALGSLLEDTAARLDCLPEKHELEFLRSFGMEPRPAQPALAWAALVSPWRERVPAGTAFYLSGDGERLWRTQREASAGPCRPVFMVFAGEKSGKLISSPPPEPGAPVRLFDFRPAGAQRREVRFSHPDVFASRQGCAAALVFSGASEELLEFLTDPSKVSWSLEDSGEGALLDPPCLEGNKLLFRLPPAPDGRALLVRVKDGAVPPAGQAGTVFAQTRREDLPAGTVLTEEGVQGEKTFLPFGEELGLWRSCCLSCPDALSLRGAEVSLSWTAALGSRELPLPGTGREQPLKLVMRRLPPEPPEVREVYADVTAWEYWDGGWRPLPGAEKYVRVFGPLEEGPARLETRFRWPEDAEPCMLQGRMEYWLRWRLRAAEDYGVLPRRCHFPEITDLQFFAVLRDAPIKLERRCGLEEAFSPAERRRPLFPPLTGPGNGWWIGFDPPPEGEPLDLWLAMEARTPGGGLTAWEAVPNRGERPLSMEDGTGGLSHSGVISLRGIRGERTVRFGKKLWWLCLRDEAGVLSGGGAGPVLTALNCGAVLLRSEGDAACAPGESLRPLRGGTVSGSLCTGDFGGCRPEGEERTLLRARNLRRYLGRGMSEVDVDHLLRDALPDVVRTRCVRKEDVMEVGVLLRDVALHSAAFGHRKGEIVRLLERESVFPALGLEIAVREPNFYAIHTSVWLIPPEGTDPSVFQQSVQEALARFLHPVTGGPERCGWRMGKLPGAEELKDLIRSSLPEAELAELIAVAAAPGGREVEAGDVQDPFALPLGGVHTITLLKGGTICGG